jgi:hypothetical protein
MVGQSARQFHLTLPSDSVTLWVTSLMSLPSDPSSFAEGMWLDGVFTCTVSAGTGRTVHCAANAEARSKKKMRLTKRSRKILAGRGRFSVTRWVYEGVSKSFRTDCHEMSIWGCIQKFPDWLPGARTANVTALCHYVQLYRYIVNQSSEFCRHNPLLLNECLLFISLLSTKLLVTPSYSPWSIPPGRDQAHA